MGVRDEYARTRPAGTLVWVLLLWCPLSKTPAFCAGLYLVNLPGYGHHLDDLASIWSLLDFHISLGFSFLARRYISTLHTYNKRCNRLPALALYLCDEKKFPYKGRRRDRQDTQLTIGAQQTAKATS